MTDATSTGGITPALLGPADIRRLADSLGLQPTKKLGQNFLHDPNTVRKILAAADIDGDTIALEVGPGLGSLTLGLVGVARAVVAVEIDTRLAGLLPTTVRSRAGERAAALTLITADALALTADDYVRHTGGLQMPTALVANLPYNVAVPVLLHMLAEFPTITRVLVMVQKEVADRLAAAPGGKLYGVPSVKASLYGRVRRAGTIGTAVFWPAPNVDSGLVRIDRYAPGEVDWDLTDALRREVFPIVDAAFAQRRKTLRAALGGYFGSPDQAERCLVAAGIDPKQRGEKLTAADYVAIAAAARDLGCRRPTPARPADA